MGITAIVFTALLALPNCRSPWLFGFILQDASQPVELSAGRTSAIWIVFNVILALLPLAVVPLFKGFFDPSGNIPIDRKLLRDGELFFFSSTLTAASIGKAVELYAKKQPSVDIFTFLALLVTLFLAAICFGGAVSAKIKREENTASATQLSPGDKRIANTSIVIALLAVALSFVSFYQGGFK